MAVCSDAIISMMNGNRLNFTWSDVIDAGGYTMWTTHEFGVNGGISGYVIWKQQIGNSSQAGFMNKNDRNRQRSNFWGENDKIGSDSKPLEISHAYGTYVNNRNYFYYRDEN